MLKKIIMGVVPVMCLVIFSGCGYNKLPHNAVMYGDIYMNRTWLQDEFYEANLTTGSWSDVQQEYLTGDAYPQNRTIFITDSVEYSKVFKEFPVDVDFENSMIVMHCFTTASSSTYEIKDIAVDEYSLVVNYRNPVSRGNTAPNASVPLTKWIIVIMDKLDIEAAEFVLYN